MVCLPVTVFLFAVECQHPQIQSSAQNMDSDDPHRLLGGRLSLHAWQRLAATICWVPFLPVTCPVHCVSPKGGELSQGVSLLGSIALILQQTGNLRSIAVCMPGCAWPTKHTVVWPAQGRDSHCYAWPRDATSTHT